MYLLPPPTAFSRLPSPPPRYGVSFFTLLALVFVACFIGLSNAVSMMTEQLEEAAAQFNFALRSE